MSNPVWTYTFRCNASDWTPTSIKALCKFFGKHWVFQKERGEETGYEHFQGTISLKKKARKTELMASMVRETFAVPNYLEPASSQAGAFQYAMKADTRIEGPWQDTDDSCEFVPYHLEGITLRPWQQAIADTGKPEARNPRTIDVLVDPAGNIGKSIVAEYCDLHGLGVDLPPVNDAEKLIATTCNILQGTNCRDPKILFLDLPRALPKDKLGGMMNAIEQIKRGKVYDQRYHYTKWRFHPPRVWVFTNRIPNAEDLSRDRWVYWQVNSLGTLSRWSGVPSDAEWAPE